MKLEHRITSAPTEPRVNAVLRARVSSITIERNVVVVNWTIYTPKVRKPSKEPSNG